MTAASDIECNAVDEEDASSTSRGFVKVILSWIHILIHYLAQFTKMLDVY
jgi:hypothetical protein